MRAARRHHTPSPSGLGGWFCTLENLLFRTRIHWVNDNISRCLFRALLFILALLVATSIWLFCFAESFFSLTSRLLFTLGCHARRSRLVFAKVSQSEAPVGVVSWSHRILDLSLGGPRGKKNRRPLQLLLLPYDRADLVQSVPR